MPLIGYTGFGFGFVNLKLFKKLYFNNVSSFYRHLVNVFIINDIRNFKLKMSSFLKFIEFENSLNACIVPLNFIDSPVSMSCIQFNLYSISKLIQNILILPKRNNFSSIPRGVAAQL